MRARMRTWLAIFAAAAMTIPQPVHGDLNAAALFAAVESGNLPAVRRALDGGADLEVRNADGLTPLMAAVRAGSVDVARELLARGADVNARIGFYGITALTLAGRFGSDSPIAALLVQAGAGRDVADERNRMRVVVTELE